MQCRGMPFGAPPLVWTAHQVDRAFAAMDQKPGMRMLAVLYLLVLHLLVVL